MCRRFESRGGGTWNVTPFKRIYARMPIQITLSVAAEITEPITRSSTPARQRQTADWS